MWVLVEKFFVERCIAYKARENVHVEGIASLDENITIQNECDL